MCAGVSILPLSVIFLLNFGTGPPVLAFLFSIFHFIIQQTCFLLLFSEIVCAQLSLNLSQHVTSINNDHPIYAFQENVTISCKRGFTGKTTTTKCTDVNKWSKTTPICTSEYLIWNIIPLL
jgi:hypothetical protein